MKSVFIVLYNGSVSSEGYDAVEKAIKFIESRTGNPNPDLFKWIWLDEDNNIYQIKEISIR